MTTDVHDRGAHFHRCDFQVHTPRDAQWKGARATTTPERKTYAVEFVAKCREIGLEAVAITDHHDLLFAPLIREAARAEQGADGSPLPASKQLVVFPGVELTLALARQAIVILDASFPDDRLPQVLQTLAISTVDADQAILPDVNPLDHINSLAELHRKLDEHDWLRGRYIVLPNVTDSGHKTILRKGMQAEYKDMPCIGGYLDGSVTDLGAGNTKILAGQDAAWGNKTVAVFQTSDSRSRDFAKLGAYSTWVKWAEPTAEALRQACLGQQSRIVHATPELPTVTIQRVFVSNSKFLGPFELQLNPQYTAIIGGRGTGKSTILDYLRWGLCDQTAQTDDDDLANPSRRRELLIENTLRAVGGQIEVHFSINDIQHVVRRYASTGEILLKVGSDEFENVREENVRALLPIHAYSQKQLSSVALRVEELMRFITAPIRRGLESIDEQVVEVSGRFRENYARVQRARDLDSAAARQRLAEKSLGEQAVNLRKAMTDLSSEDQSSLRDKPRYDRVRDAERSAEQDLDETAAAAEALLEAIEQATEALLAHAAPPDGLADVVTTVHQERLLVLQQLKGQTREIVDGIAQTRLAQSPLSQSQAALATAFDEFDRQYDRVKMRSNAHDARLIELTDVEKRRKAASDLLARHERDRKALGEPIATHAELRSELVGLYEQRSELLGNECDQVTKLSDGLLRATISRGQGLAGVERRFRSFVQGSGIRGARVDELFRALRVETDPLATWELVLDEIEKVLLLSDNVQVTSELTPTLSRLTFGIADQHRMRGKITSDGWLDLSLTPILDEPVFQYRTRDQEYIAFSAASAGQQATALLKILLAQTGMPLIIDQPEEDLDSQVVQDVVSQIWAAKKARQLVFASHNANLVVNGDAELVIACDYRTAGDQSGGKISLQGAIDVPSVRVEITKVMEGGEKAFRLRKDRYGF